MSGPFSRSLADEMDRIAAFWVEGAELPPADLEAAIDAGARAGNGAALAAYEAAAWASCVAAGKVTA